MFENNPFRQHRANTEALKEDPAHYAAIAKANARKQAERDKADPEAAKKREKAKAAIDKKFTKNPVKPADIGRHSSSFIGRRNESTTYVIPEEIPANERTAFHGAAADAAKKGKKSFNFGGKTHPVTMKKDTANKIADQKEAVKYPHMMYEPKTGKEVTAKTPMDHAKFAKMGYTHDKPKMKESTMTFREKLMSIFEGDRKAHYKGATEPEGMHDKMKSSKGAMDMVNTPKDVAADGKKVNDDNAAKSAEKKMGKAKKRSGGDNIDKGDTKIVPGGTPVKEPSMAKEEYGMFGKKISNNLLDAVNQVTELSKKTLDSYKDKAQKQISKVNTDPNRKPTDKFGHSSTYQKRQRGMDSATLKRDKERGKERLIHDLGMRPGKAAPAKARNS